MKALKRVRCLAFVLILAVAAAAVPLLNAPESASHAASSRLKAPQKVKAVSADAHAIRVSWQKVKQAKGYIIYRYDKNRKKYKAVKRVSAKKRSWTNSGLKTDQIYKYKVRAYKKVKGKQKKGYASYRVSAKPQTKASETKNVRWVSLFSSAGEVYPGYRGECWASVSAGSFKKDAKVVSKKLVWKSTNPKVVKVRKNGSFVVLRPGKAYITARAHNGVQARCKIKAYGYSAKIDGKKISLGEKITSLNKKFGKPYYGNLNDHNLYGGSIDKRLKVYIYGSAPQKLTVLAFAGRVEAYAATDAASFNLLGVRSGEAGSSAIKKKLKSRWRYVEYIDMSEWEEGQGCYYIGGNEDDTSDVLIDVTGGTVRGFAVGGENLPGSVAYTMMMQ